MERIHGESLGSRWLSLTTQEVKHVMAQIAEMERKIFSYPLPGYGGLYYKRDLNDEFRIPLRVEDFCIGPVAARQFWHGKRLQMELDRGPWISPEECLTSAARREIDCSLDYAKPRPRQTFLLPTIYNIDPSEHVPLLSKYLILAPHLVPKTSALQH